MEWGGDVDAKGQSKHETGAVINCKNKHMREQKSGGHLWTERTSATVDADSARSPKARTIDRGPRVDRDAQ